MYQPMHAPDTDPDKETRPAAGTLLSRYRHTRAATELLCKPLQLEDYVVQPITDVSPPKWHLAHTTWFFERFILVPHITNYRVYHPQFHFLFNSYYESAGPFWERARRGVLSRPTVEEVYRYRAYVDEHMAELLLKTEALESSKNISEALVLGINHEQQHQELLLMDIKYILWTNPLRPAYVTDYRETLEARTDGDAALQTVANGIYEIGYDGRDFAYDNEKPRHRVFLDSFSIGKSPVSNAEFLEFIEAGGYRNPAWWLSDGWATVKQCGWVAPLYWEKAVSQWSTMTMNGMQKLDLHEPVCHVSYFEADAFARWRRARLPTEAEWEVAEQSRKASKPRFVWEWTASAYSPYPGFKPFEPPFQEYNGKFMCNQFVLRGGCFATPVGHLRQTYRNYFAPQSRWQFSGLRLATCTCKENTNEPS